MFHHHYSQEASAEHSVRYIGKMLKDALEDPEMQVSSRLVTSFTASPRDTLDKSARILDGS